MKEKECTDNEAGILSSDSSVILVLKQESPDGGTTAWLQVLGAFFMYFNTWGKPSDTDHDETILTNHGSDLGIVSSYGTYQVFYEDAILSRAASDSELLPCSSPPKIRCLLT